MPSFYLTSDWAQLGCLFLAWAPLLCQSLCSCDLLRLEHQDRVRLWLQEGGLWFWVLVFAMTCITPGQQQNSNALYLQKFEIWRYAAAAVVILIALDDGFSAWRDGGFKPGAVWGTGGRKSGLRRYLLTAGGLNYLFVDGLLLAAACLSLPAADRLGPWNLLATGLLIFLRTWWIRPRLKQRQAQEIGLNSIKEALDQLGTGVAFAENNGAIVLTNRAMLDFMGRFLPKRYQDIRELWDALQPSSAVSPLQKKKLLGQMLLREKNGKSYLAALEPLASGQVPLWQLTLADITEEDNINRKLQDQNKHLLEECGALRQVLANLEAVKRQQVATELRFKVHDLLGQRIAFLQQVLNNVKPDYARVVPLLENLLRDWREAPEETPRQNLNNLRSVYCNIGINFWVEGALPEDGPVAAVFVNIIREAATNAVRHGRADTIKVNFIRGGNREILEITNNGLTPEGKLIFGTGLKGMKMRLDRIGGIMKITTKPVFTLRAEVERR